MRRLVVVLWLGLAGPWAWAQGPDPALLERYAAEGRQALAERRLEDAARAFEKLRELTPETAEVHAQLGMIRFRQRDFGGAVPALREALELKPGLPNVDVLLAVCLSELGRYEEALPGLQKGFRQTADASMQRVTGLALQRSYNGLGMDDKAAEVALEMTRLHPEDPEVLYHAGRLISNYAYLLTMRLAEVGPTSVWMYLAAGEANESIGTYDAALEDYRKVLELDPDRPGIHYRRGRVHLARARPPFAAADAEALAAQEFEAELRTDPTNANAAYELGEITRKAGDLERARALFAQAVEHYPDFEQGQLGLGRVLVAQGEPALALPHLEKAVALDPGNEFTFYQLWRAHRALDHTDEAKRAQAEFQRLRDKKREEERLGLLRRSIVTQQEIDEGTSPP